MLNTRLRISGFTLIALVSILAGCGKASPLRNPEVENSLPPVGVSDSSGMVVRARAALQVEVAPESPLASFLRKTGQSFWITPAWAVSGTQSVTVVYAPSAEMTIDPSQFIVPTPSAAVLDFGFLAVQTLQDNNLRVCGISGKAKCREARLRMYTTGTAGAGLYNAEDGYGAPVQAGISGGAAAVVGLDASGAATLQSYLIPAKKNVLRLSDFSPTPVFQIASDFTNAGAGTYQTTLVLEYVLVE